MEDRVSTGVLGLDDKMEGGFVRGSVNFITGKTGTGKTAFCASFLYAGALRGEKGVYVTTEEREEDIKNDVAAMFYWNLEELEKKGMLKFVSIRPEIPLKVISGEDLAKVVRLYMYELISRIEEVVKEFGATLLVVDSLSLVESFVRDEYLKKVALMQFIDRLKDLGVTSVLTGTIPEGSEVLSTSGIIEFLVDSVIKLDFVPVMEEFKRTLTIRKMRRTDHSIYIHPFDITKTGVKIIEVEQA